MSDGDRWDAKKVRPVADKLVELLAPACERIEIAGSLRRGKKLVGDIELVLIDKVVERPSSDLFGTPVKRSLLGPILVQLEDDGKLVKVMGGDKMKKYRIATVKRELHVDMFIVDPRGWGNQLAIRTGPSGFSAKMVTPRHKGGLLGSSYAVQGGLVWRSRSDLHPPTDGSRPPEGFNVIDGSMYELYTCLEERDFMGLLSCGYVEPSKRSRL